MQVFKIIICKIQLNKMQVCIIKVANCNYAKCKYAKYKYARWNPVKYMFVTVSWWKNATKIIQKVGFGVYAPHAHKVCICTCMHTSM